MRVEVGLPMSTWDIYLNGQLLEDVISASDEKGEVVIYEVDWRSTRATGKTCYITAYDPNNSYKGFATLTCRGEVKIVSKEPKGTDAVVLIEDLHSYDQRVRTYEVVQPMRWEMKGQGMHVPIFSSPEFTHPFNERFYIQKAWAGNDESVFISLGVELAHDIVRLKIIRPAIEIKINGFTVPGKGAVSSYYEDKAADLNLCPNKAISTIASQVVEYLAPITFERVFC